jgi:hypothetical protein
MKNIIKTPDKSEPKATPNNLFTKEKPKFIENPSIRSSVQDSVAMSIKGKKDLNTNSNGNKFQSFEDKKQKDFFDHRAKPAPPVYSNKIIQNKKPIRNATKNEIRETSDYGSDFDDEVPSSDELEKVADNILNNVKSPGQNPYKSSVDKFTVKSTVKPVPAKQLNAPIIKPKTEHKRPILKSEESTPEKKLEDSKEKAKFITAAPKPRPFKQVGNPKPKPTPEPVTQKKPSVPRQNRNNDMRTSQSSVRPSADPVAMEVLTNENTKLLKDIQELATQLDVKMVTLHRKANYSMIKGNSPEPERLLTRREKMDERTKKLKIMKRDITDMYSMLESTYKINELVQRENKIKNQQKILRKQELILKDVKKAIKGQNRFFKHVERTDEHAAHTEDIEVHYVEAKNKFRDLKEQFRTEDKTLKEQHLRVENYRHKSHRIKEIIQIKKNNDSISGLKQDATQEDMDEISLNIEKLEERKAFKLQKYREITAEQDAKIHLLNKIIGKYNKEFRHKEDEERILALKIKEFKRLSQGKYIKSVGRAKKPSKSVARKPSYYTPAKNTKKFKVSKNKPITSRKRIEKSYDEEEKDSVNNLDITNEKYEPEYTLNQKVVIEQSHEEDDYGSEFDKFEASISMKKETENAKAAGNMINSNNTQETTNLSSKPSHSLPLHTHILY